MDRRPLQRREPGSGHRRGDDLARLPPSIRPIAALLPVPRSNGPGRPMPPEPRTRLLMGVSLPGVGYGDDGAATRRSRSPTGTHAVTRDFSPASTPAGGYALWSRYLDVDENGSISATDLPLALEVPSRDDQCRAARFAVVSKMT